MANKIDLNSRRKVLSLLFGGVGLLQISLVGCAMGPKWVDHAIKFNQISSVDMDKSRLPDIEILEWTYGEKDVGYEGQAQKGRRAVYKIGHSPLNGGTYGSMPVGDFLYVKWRIKQSGEVREDNVDLKSHLPNDIDHYEIFFYVTESQLYVFLFPPRWDEPILPETNKTIVAGGTHPRITQGHTIIDIPGIDKFQIYLAKNAHCAIKGSDSAQSRGHAELPRLFRTA